ncbi:MAG: type II secretion system F family protein [Clostridium sp.]|jgi:Flp pilus assembly protein TadB|nr:type II secretion system F family protein [Clostridium sp.]
MGWKIIFLLNLFLAFLLLSLWVRRERILRNIMRRTYDSMDGLARRREQDNRKNLELLQKRKGYLYRMEQRLVYSGMARKFPFLTPEVWLLLNLAVSAVFYVAGFLLTGGLTGGAAGIILLQILRYAVENILMSRNYKSVNENLIKFLDFLGNYSITAGEVTGILNQISRYVEEPLKSVLDECYYEAQTSGDVKLALLSMAEKIEHPRFKELVRNMEISVRYSADFAVFVSNSKRAVQEHLRTRQERNSLMHDAAANMMILAGMSVVALLSVEQLINTSIWGILLHTLPGRIGTGLLLMIFGLFGRQIRNINR